MDRRDTEAGEGEGGEFQLAWVDKSLDNINVLSVFCTFWFVLLFLLLFLLLLPNLCISIPPFAVIIYTIQFTSFVRIAAGLYTFGTLIDLICLHKSSNCMHSSTTHSTAIYSFYPFFLLLRCDTFRRQEDYERFNSI